MKRRTKWLAVVLCLTMFMAMALGSGSTDSSSTIKEVSSVNNSKTDAENVTSSGANSNSSSSVSIEEQVIYDSNNIKITATGIEDGWLGTELKLLIENNSDKSVTIQTRNANVNGFMVDTMMSADVAAGKKANDSLTFETKGLKECGIETIATMEFYFHIFDSSTWDEIVDTNVIKLDTSAASTYQQVVDDSGTVLVDKNGVRIICKGLSEKGSFWGPGIILYIENNSNKDVTIQVRDTSVNGFMVDSSMSEDVVSSKKAMSAIQFFSSDLEKNSITDITEAEFYFHIFDEKTWDTIFDSDKMSIEF